MSCCVPSNSFVSREQWAPLAEEKMNTEKPDNLASVASILVAVSVVVVVVNQKFSYCCIWITWREQILKLPIPGSLHGDSQSLVGCPRTAIFQHPQGWFSCRLLASCTLRHRWKALSVWFRLLGCLFQGGACAQCHPGRPCPMNHYCTLPPPHAAGHARPCPFHFSILIALVSPPSTWICQVFINGKTGELARREGLQFRGIS